MMMRQCIGEHEARTTMKWSFVSVREGMNGNGGGRTKDGRENKKNTQGRRSMTSSAVLCRCRVIYHHPYPVGILSSSSGFQFVDA